MKKTILALALVLTIGLSTTFANRAEGVSEKIINSFKQDFADARDIQWEISKEYVKATFSLSGQIMFAYYSADANLLAVTRNLVSGQLPINLLADIKKNYSSYWITQLFEMAIDHETSYYITLENENQTVVMKSNGAAGWEVFKKERKVIAQ
jgi:hypothetical protein